MGDLFGIRRQRAGKIFLTYVEKVASSLRTFIDYPQQSNITLPATFKNQHKDVILQCFEISIGKPPKLLEQSLSWSHGKHTNTVKYLIGCTPDGLIIFISEGFFGIITDNDIVRKSGFMDFIKKDTNFMSDPGFKNVNAEIFSKAATLIKLETNTCDASQTKEEAKLSKSIAATRMPIVKVIKKIRNFAFLKPHSSVLNYKRSIVIAAAICVHITNNK